MTNNNKDFLIYLLYLVYTTYSKSVSLRNRLLEISRRSGSQFLSITYMINPFPDPGIRDREPRSENALIETRFALEARSRAPSSDGT